MTIFWDKTPMPTRYELVASPMVRQDTDVYPGPPVPRLSGEERWPHSITHVDRPRKGHGY